MAPARGVAERRGHGRSLRLLRRAAAPPAPGGHRSGARRGRGALAERHHCTSCHRPGLVGQEQVARLAGQDLDYLLRLLRAFRARTASDLDGSMTVATQPLTDDEIVSLVHFIATLGEP
jgi:cytochrome c553